MQGLWLTEGRDRERNSGVCESLCKCLRWGVLKQMHRILQQNHHTPHSDEEVTDLFHCLSFSRTHTHKHHSVEVPECVPVSS